ILLHFYYLYKKNMEERLLKKAQELNKAKINKKIEMLQSEIEQMNSVNKEAMLPQMKQWFDEANKMYASEEEVTKYVSSKYNEKLASHEEEMKNLINVTRRVLIDQL
ncbi:MAG: hypothetical protein LBV48_01810, partial [Mycoplasmataceae bacterium]|nr:hypothetical protein [Mycoplasmataceae bacterium]